MEFFAVVVVIGILMSIFGEQIIDILGILLLIIIVKIAIKIISKIINVTKSYDCNINSSKDCQNESNSKSDQEQRENLERAKEYERKRRKEILSRPVTGDFFAKNNTFRDDNGWRLYDCIHDREHSSLSEPCCYCARRVSGPCSVKE